MIQFSAHESITIVESHGTIWISGKVAPDVSVSLFISAQEAFDLGRQLIKASGISSQPEATALDAEQQITAVQASGELPS